MSSIYLKSDIISIQWAMCCVAHGVNVFSMRTGSSRGFFFPFDVILEVISSFLSPGPCLTLPSPQPEQGASSMEDCLNLHWSNVGLQLGHRRVGLSYQSSGQINHSHACLAAILVQTLTAGCAAVPTVQVTVSFRTMRFYTFLDWVSFWLI